MAEPGRRARARDRFASASPGRKALLMAGAVLVIAVSALLVRFLLRPPPVEADVVRREDVARILALTGEIAPVARVDIVPEVTAEIVDLPVDEGAPVAAGQLLARLESTEPRARLAQARATLDAQRAELAQAVRELRRARRLAPAGAIAEQELEQAALAVERARARVREQAARVEELEAITGRYTIEAPIAGVVLDRPVDPGQVVGPEDVIYEIAVAARRRVEADADERYVDELEPGMFAVISPVGMERTWEGDISFIAREVDAETGAVDVRIRFQDMPPWLVFGLSVDVNIIVARHEDALTVERAAVADIDSEPWVIEIVDGRTVRQPVDVIDWPSERIVVTAGLQAGDVVALLPEQVTAGERARPIPPEPEPGERDAL